MPTKDIQLVRTLEEVVALLKRSGELHWWNLIDGDLFFLRKEDLYGAERFFTYFGGMGSLNDLWLCQANGHSIPIESERVVSEEFQRVRDQS